MQNMTEEYKRRQCFPLRLAASLRTQANNLAHSEGISLNHFISLAVAEKISRMEHDLWLQQRMALHESKSNKNNSQELLLKTTQDKAIRFPTSSRV